MIGRFGSGKWGLAKLGATVGAVLVGLALTASMATSEGTQGQVRHGAWTTGDLHTHTYLTDGSNTEAQVVDKAFNTFGLDWMANSEHGGTSARDPLALASRRLCGAGSPCRSIRSRSCRTCGRPTTTIC